jgi:hypothetical protein
MHAFILWAVMLLLADDQITTFGGAARQYR